MTITITITINISMTRDTLFQTYTVSDCLLPNIIEIAIANAIAVAVTIDTAGPSEKLPTLAAFASL
jgi:hypothetical protein